MNTSHKYSCLFCLIMAGEALLGNGITDTTLRLNDVLIQKDRNQLSTPASEKDNTLLDFSQQQGRKFSDVLNEYSGIYLKNYGVGQLSSISLNGSSAAQTNILWNGIKLNSPTTGQVDLSLFDLEGGDRLSISTTEQNHSAVGANGLGGTIALDNVLHLDDSQHIHSFDVIHIGSFGERAISSSNIYGIGSFKGATKLALLGSDNDFPFVNDTKIGAPVMREKNARTQQLSFTQQLQYTFRKPYTIGADLWITDADRLLPPVMTSDAGHEHQWDQSYRAMAYITGSRSHFHFSFRTAYLYDRLRYTNPVAFIYSRSSSQAVRNVFSASYILAQSVTIDGVVNYDHESATSTGFDALHHRDLMGLYLAVSYRYHKGLITGVSAHGDLQDFHPLPISPSVFIGYEKRMQHNNYLKAILSGERNYRIPALNDFYWSGAGNVNLRPEKAWKGSLHIAFDHSFWLKLMVDGFYNYVTDWILWHPTQTGLWVPDNVKRVLSRGATVNIHLQSIADMKSKRFIASGYISYSYTNTISLDAVAVNDNSKGKQLIYVPLHNFTASIRLQYYRFYISCMHSHTGERYITTDDSQSLKAYYLTHLEAGKDFYFAGQQISVSFRVNNVANIQYQMVADRPMAGRSYEATVRLNLSR